MAHSEISAADAVAQASQPVLEFARGWLLNKETTRRGDELGLRKGRGFWVNGRAGVVGDVDADVACAAVGFMAPGKFREIWEDRPAGASSRELAAEYAQCCFAWARSGVLDAVPEARLARLTELTRRVVDAALPTTGALFAGWRAMPAPSDAPGAAALALHVLRELRGGAHITAVLASGMTPLDAAMSAPPPRGGADWAADLGWAEPFPDPAGLAEKRAAAEALTSSLVAPTYEALAPAERGELVDLVVEARAAIG
ncbi:MAG: SCO6745 family protein [Acidimicrobiales bacterium]